uniref:Uncharacterized protein n=1 Tax=Arundo donax TaxID=35708 RepID=A0A0A9DLH1_ARUDO
MATGAAALGRLAAGERERRHVSGAGGSAGGCHGDDEVHESGDDGSVDVPAVSAEVPREHPLEPVPVARAVRGHHLLHGRPEVAVRVGRLERHRHAVAEGRHRLVMAGVRRRLPLEDGAGRRVWLEEEAVVGAEAADDGVGHVVSGRGRGGLRLGGQAVGRAVGVVRARGGVGEGGLARVEEEGRDGLGGGGRGAEGLGPWVLAGRPHPRRWGGGRGRRR